jgi:hypothetical protein
VSSPYRGSWSRGHQVLTLVERDGEDYRTTSLESVVFVPLIGAEGFAEEEAGAAPTDAG